MTDGLRFISPCSLHKGRMSAEGVVTGEEPAPGVWSELVSRERLYLFLGVFAIELTLFFMAMAIPLDPASLNAAQQQANSTFGGLDKHNPVGLFNLILVNNGRIALVDMAPILGGFVFVLSMVATGQIIQALAASNGGPSLVYGIFLFLFPFTYFELAAYAFAFSSGVMVLVSGARRRLGREVKVFLAEALVVLGALVLAAAMETLTILSYIVGFALWVPVGLLSVFVISRLRRRP